MYAGYAVSTASQLGLKTLRGAAIEKRRSAATPLWQRSSRRGRN